MWRGETESWYDVIKNGERKCLTGFERGEKNDGQSPTGLEDSEQMGIENLLISSHLLPVGNISPSICFVMWYMK